MIQRNSAIDLAKFTAAILVVAIHTRPFADISGFVDFLFVDIICRMAVPFFAVCTGFYLAIAVWQKEMLLPVRSAFLKVLKMYLGWSLLFLLIHLYDWYSTNALSAEYVMGWCKSLFISSSYFHLWYLVALLYALPVYGLFLKFVPRRLYALFAVLLWVYHSVSYGYLAYVPSAMQPFFFADTMCESLHTGLTRMLPLLLAGAWLTELVRHVNRRTMYMVFVLFLVLLIVEVSWLRHIGGARWSFIVFTLPMAMALFGSVYLTGGVNIPNSQFLAKISMTVYCLHPAVIWLFRDWQLFSFLNFILVAIVTILLSVAYQNLKEYEWG